MSSVTPSASAVSEPKASVSAGAAGAQDAPPIRLMRTGRFTSTEGESVSFSADDLAAIAESYDPASDPAPLVVGHPAMHDPAFGWVDRLAVEGDALLAYPAKVQPAFAEMVNQGRFSKVSARFYAPGHPGNPKPGQRYLMHIGFLGAAAPAVKGLGTVSLGEDAAGGALITIDMPAELHATTSFAERGGQQEKPVTQIIDESAPAAQAQEQSFAEREAGLAAREAALKVSEEAMAKAARAARHAEHESFAEGLVSQAKLAPAGKALVIGVLDALTDAATDAATGPEGSTISFGEGEASKLSPASAFKQLLGGAQPVISLGEFAPASKAALADRDPSQIAREAQSFAESEAKAGRPISIAAAVRHIEMKGSK